MILARNHQRLLNGSKYLFLAFVVGIITSCGAFKNAQKKKDIDKKVLEDVSSEMDTLQWKKIPESELKPIKKEEIVEPVKETYDAFKKGSYNLGLLIPFNATEANMNFEDSDLKFVNYYAGVKLALSDLGELGTGLNVSVYDSERSNEVIKSKLNSNALGNNDIIIGPYERTGLQETAAFGKKNKVAVISPWLASTKITTDNPYYVQLRPSLSSHYFKIIEHINQNFDESEILLIGRDNASDKNRFRYFQKTHTALNNMKRGEGLTEFLVSEDSLSYGDSAFDSLFIEGGKKAIILPNWNYNDEDFIYSCLRRLNIERGISEIHVYGMPIIYDSEKMDFDFYRNLNIKICLSEFVDWEDEPVKSFTRRYFDEYGDLPTSDAFEGYDMMKFIGTNLIKYGVNFHLHLEEDSNRYLQTAYDIQRVYDPEDEKFEKINYLENKHLDLIQYIGSKFVKID